MWQVIRKLIAGGYPLFSLPLSLCMSEEQEKDPATKAKNKKQKQQGLEYSNKESQEITVFRLGNTK